MKLLTITVNLIDLIQANNSRFHNFHHQKLESLKENIIISHV
jgi:hypothetical protein